MKADEFSKKMMEKKFSKKHRDLADRSKRTIADSQRQVGLRDAEPIIDEDHQNIYGADSEPGHEMHRIRRSRPLLWEKIKNWD